MGFFIKYTTFIIILSLASIANADEWTDVDTVMQSIYSAYHIADWNQTLQIANDRSYYRVNGIYYESYQGRSETNKILGRHPSKDQVNLYFASTLLAHYYIARKLSQPYRAYWQSIWLSIQYDIVRNNKRKGLNINFKF